MCALRNHARKHTNDNENQARNIIGNLTTSSVCDAKQNSPWWAKTSLLEVRESFTSQREKSEKLPGLVSRLVWSKTATKHEKASFCRLILVIFQSQGKVKDDAE